jgi:hypothetical protein
MEDGVLFYGHLVHFTVFCYILWNIMVQFVAIWYIFPVLLFCTKKNLATLVGTVSFRTLFLTSFFVLYVHTVSASHLAHSLRPA